ncbi:MAG: ABC transporter permease [Planctomycetes bacterium]|nr:ABC transporter permease [Planctomycetota bacterium]
MVLVFILRRLLIFVPLMALVVTVSFFLMRAAPGSPFLRENQKIADQEILVRLETEYHLNDPWYSQLWHYSRGLVTGELVSIKFKGRTVRDIIGDSLPVSMSLGMLSLALALLVGVPIGAYTALRQNQFADWALTAAVLVGISVPNFMVAAVLVVLLSFNLTFFAPAGWGQLDQVVLPALVLALPYAAYVARLARVGFLETLSQDYIRTARAKGLTSAQVVLGHALGNSVLPVVSFLGPAVAGILTGSLVVEKVFAIPGIAGVFVNSALNRDYPVVFGTVVLYAAFIYGMNLIVDVAYRLLDPRVEVSA